MDQPRMTEANYKAWQRHFAKHTRSSETVQVPKDVFEFLLATNEAYGAIEGGDIAVVASAQMLALDLLREVAHQEGLPEGSV